MNKYFFKIFSGKIAFLIMFCDIGKSVSLQKIDKEK